jgi:enamine deaminase RidA (YjgF/YER057c/UK114 family)
MKNLAALCLMIAIISPSFAQKTDVEKKLKELGLTLPAPQKPIANYVKAVRSGNLVFLAGHGPSNADGTDIAGKVGRDLTVPQGYEAAKSVGLNLLTSLKAEIGDLNKVKRIVKVLGMVNCTEGFTEQPKVINGFSDLMVAVFGEKGKHARSAVGMYTLPNNISVEIEMVVEVE